MAVRVVIILALCAAFACRADCATTLPLTGALTLPGCDAKTQTCLTSDEAFAANAEAFKQDPTEYAFLGTTGSPWRIYDGALRVIPLDALAAKIRASGKQRVLLGTSWSGVKPDKETPPLTSRLSKLLGGLPVRGLDGFLWLSSKGALRTTRQGSTIVAGEYAVVSGADVMPAASFTRFLSIGDDAVDPALFLLRGAAWDILGLCPEKALASFEQAAALGNVSASWNAAQMLLEKDRPKALAYLRRAAQAGDARSRDLLTALGGTAPDAGAPR
jgi:hypothetical protein